MSDPQAVRIWDVQVPPRSNRVIKGHVLPSIAGTINRVIRSGKHRERRISIEIHNAETEMLNDKPMPSTSHMKPCSAKHPHSMDRLLSSDSSDGGGLRPNDKILVRILRKPQKEDDKQKHSALIKAMQLVSLDRFGTTAGFGTTADHSDSASESLVSHHTGESVWLEHKRYVLDAVKLFKVSNNTCYLKLGNGGSQEVRQVIFATEAEAVAFCEQIKGLEKLNSAVAKQKIELFQQQSMPLSNSALSLRSQGTGTTTSHSSDHIQVLVEIVAAYNLPKATNRSVDPYVAVFMGQKKIHRTKNLSKQSNPIWTVASGSLFLLDTTVDRFFHTSGLTLMVKDANGIGRNDLVAKFTVPHRDVLEGTGKRTEYPLFSNRGETLAGSFIVLRFRPAEPEDLDFMEELATNQASKKKGIHAKDVFVPPKNQNGLTLKWKVRPGPNGKEYRVKPGPDPRRESATTWMTEARMEDVCKNISSSWIEAGSGDTGKLYFEVLAFDGLPKMDVLSKNDCFACIIFEDAVVNTEVISDCNSPRFMPWTQRAFVFNVNHPTSQVLVGIFDQDSLSSDDEIGRVAIDVSNFVPSTEYTLTFDLHTTGYLEKRTKVGTITVRLWVDWGDYRKTFLKALGRPKQNFINTSSRQEFRAAHFTAIGSENIHTLDLAVLKSYAKELKTTLKTIKIPIKKAAISVLLWRGHYPIHFVVPWYTASSNEEHNVSLRQRFLKPVAVWLPLHSMTAFLFGVLLVEDLNYLPSFLFFSIAWVFLASNGEQRSHPNPWHQCKSFSQMWLAFVKGEPVPDNITPYQDMDKIVIYETKKQSALQWGLELDEKSPDDLVQELMAQEEEERKTSRMTQIIESRRGGGLLDIAPLKKVLLPIQLKLGKVCVAIRVSKSFLSWNARFYSFLITNLCLALGFATLWVPWDLVLRHSFRVLVWVFLGPWMKLIDLQLQRQARSGKLRVEQFLSEFKSVMTRSRSRRTRDENAVKLRDFKSYLFGSYITKLPVMKEYRHRDYPLPSSSARPCSTKIPPEAITAVVNGQYVKGDMIPRWKKTGKRSISADATTLEDAETDPLISSEITVDRKNMMY